MIFIDWIIVLIVLAGMIFSVNLSKGLMKSVTDFLSAGRTAGRYLIAVSSGIAGLGAISVVMFLLSLLWGGKFHVALLTSTISPLALFFLFDKVLKIRFPRGIITNWYYG